ncbi:hypothetical protein AGMMS50239_40310 [Bacteroidia bacterium]|nr:hypothetical protein AGMMS50239_40310 [Bacteroidia bacterium]
MFGIDDPGIYIAYLLAIGCLVFSIFYGVSKWNEKDDDDVFNPKNPEK